MFLIYIFVVNLTTTKVKGFSNNFSLWKIIFFEKHKNCVYIIVYFLIIDKTKV